MDAVDTQRSHRDEGETPQGHGLAHGDVQDARDGVSHDHDGGHGHGSGHGHGPHHHHHHGDGSPHDQPMTTEEAVRSLLLLGQVALDAQDFESAVEAYASALKLAPDEIAQYNLASLYARGLGVRRNYIEAARLFHQAALQGNEQAGKLCAKCMLDFVSEGVERKSPTDLYAAMVMFVLRVYPEAEDQRREVGNGLSAVAGTYLNQGKYEAAAKAYRAAAEFAGNGYAQRYLGWLYQAGAGVPQDDLAALYWFDRAVANGAADVALADRDALLDACRTRYAAEEFAELMATLADSCERGTPDIPASPDRAARWRTFV